MQGQTNGCQVLKFTSSVFSDRIGAWEMGQEDSFQ